MLIPASVPISAGWTGREERPNFGLIFKDLRDDRRNCTIKWCRVRLSNSKQKVEVKLSLSLSLPSRSMGGRAVKVQFHSFLTSVVNFRP